MNDMIIDKEYIQQCFKLALLATGDVSPNPLVGSVIVKNSKVVSTGHHQQSGSPHAEANAINNITNPQDLIGATLYCNLEPCCHTNKKTPPCAQKIITTGIKKVVISNLDPNPLVAGSGVKLLRENGIEVITGVLEHEGSELNQIFFHHITKKSPFVHLKMAQTLDGHLATKDKDSKWITGDESRKFVHQTRNHYDAILVGAETIRQDNPTLTVRIENTVKPIKRIILSKSGKFDFSTNVFTDEYKNKTYVVVPSNFNKDLPVNIILCPLLKESNQFDLDYLMKLLYSEHDVCSLFVEGGQMVHTSFIQQKTFDKISIFIAPKIIGDDGHSTIGNLNFSYIKDSIQFKDIKWKQIGDDMLFVANKIENSKGE